MGIRQFDQTTPADVERSSPRRAGAPEPQVTQSTGQGRLTAGIPAQGRAAEPRSQARALAMVSGGRLARAGAALLQLQRHHGNRHVQQVINGARRTTGPPAAPALQTKLVVGPADDDHEREADLMAEQVTRLPTVRRQREENDTAGVRVKPDPQHAHAGAFDAAHGFEPRMQVVRGSGRPLPASLRQEFETSFGADFGAVRIHTGDQAVQLSRDLHAQAFTHGSDLFFGAGSYAPRTSAGRRLLAHELTHVVQQGRAPSSGGSRGGAAPAGTAERIQRKLSFAHTDWSKARKAWSSGQGGRGVVFVTDEPQDPGVRPLVVKSREEAPAEVILAANLHRLGQGVWRRDAPEVRLVVAPEGTTIKRRVGGLVWGDARAKGIIGDADQPGTMVFEFAGGKDFRDLLTQQTAHSEPKFRGRRLRDDSPVRLFKDPDFLRAIGLFTAVDIFNGNNDRLAAYNPENFKIDRVNRTVLLIDNVHTSGALFAFQTMATLTRETAFDNWTKDKWPQKLRVNDFEGIARDLLLNVKEGMELWRDIGQQDRQTVNRAVDKGTGWLAQGLAEGKELLASLAGGGNLAEFTPGLTPQAEQQVLLSIRRRLIWLFPDRDFRRVNWG
jgi:hypothetical protein